MDSRDQAMLHDSGLFDGAWYVGRYPDVGLGLLAPWEHFIRFGWSLGRSPGPLFDPVFYVQRYPDIVTQGMDPLRHFLMFGRAEGRKGSLNGSATKAVSVLTPKQRLEMSGLFDARWYLEEYQDVADSGADPLQHYLQHGGKERREPGPNFDTLHYFKQCPDAKRASVPLLHYLEHGQSAGASPFPMRAEIPWWCELPHQPSAFSSETLCQLASSIPPVILLPITQYESSLPACLEALARHTHHTCRIIVIDDSASAEVAQLLDDVAAQTPFERIYHPDPVGRQKCINEASDLACGADTVLLSPQVVVSPGWLGRLRVAAYWHSTTASVSPLITPFDGEVAQVGRYVAQRSDDKLEELSYPDDRCCYLRHHFAGAGQHRQDTTTWVGDQGNPSHVDVYQSTQEVKPRAMFVLSTRTGGTPQTNQDLMGALEEERECFVLRCNSRVMSLLYFAEGIYTEVQRYHLETPISAFPHRSLEYDRVVAGWLRRYAIELVHVRHIAWHSLGLLNTVHALGIPLVFSFHDFYALCPNVKLLDEKQQFCAGACTVAAGECSQELWPSNGFPPLKHAAVGEWQREFESALSVCDAFITTTESAKRYVLARYAGLHATPFQVIPHGRDFQEMYSVGKVPTSSDPLRILFPGHLTRAKGGDIIAELASTIPARILEIHVLGHVAEDISLPDSVIQHGGYSRDEFVERVQAIDPHVGGVLSIWPETFCHTLTELWSCGLPVIGLDIGAVGDRITSSGAGWVTSDMTAKGVMQLVAQAREPDSWRLAQQRVMEWQRIARVEQRCQHMAHAYSSVYQMVCQQRFEGLAGSQRISVTCK